MDRDLVLYTIDEAAVVLKVHKRTIQNYIKAGKLKACTFGKAKKITETDLKEFINSSRG